MKKKDSKLKYVKGVDGIFFGIRQLFRSELYQMRKRNGKRNLEKISKKILKKYSKVQRNSNANWF